MERYRIVHKKLGQVEIWDKKAPVFIEGHGECTIDRCVAISSQEDGPRILRLLNQTCGED